MEPLYRQLNPERNEIRTLTLAPGKWDDEINCSIQSVSLDDDPAYSTLSYVWGDPVHLFDIKVDGHVVPVRRNLLNALLQLRHETQPLVLWVDAVCINQADFEERSQQVRIMGRIYKTTGECIIWMGTLEEEAIEPHVPFETLNPAAVQALKEMSLNVPTSTIPPPQLVDTPETSYLDIPGAFEIVKYLTNDIHLYEQPFFRKLPDGGIELDRPWSKAVYALENILRRTWWRRIWTAQEAFLPEHATIHIGPYSMPYRRFVQGVTVLDTHRWTTCCLPILDLWIGYPADTLREAVEVVKELSNLQAARANEATSAAHSLFLLSIHRSATLNHDRVYGLFGLITEFFELEAEPDYSLSLAELYAETTIQFMQNARHLCLLPYSRPQHREGALSEEEREFYSDLPTWTPDWGTYAWGDYFDIYNHGGFSADKWLAYNGTRQSNTILKLEGFQVGTVSVVGTLIQDMNVPPSEFVPIIQQWLDLARDLNIPPLAIWEILHVATHKDVGMDKAELQAAWWDILKELAANNATLQEMKDSATVNQLYFCVQSMEWLDKRSVYMTVPPAISEEAAAANPKAVSEYSTKYSKGSVGLALPNVRAGDLVYIVKGGRTPFVFRSLADESLREKALAEGIPEKELSKCFTLVGVTYIHGMMQGQAMPEQPQWENLYLF